MRSLKESILNRSSHNGEGFKAQRRELIEEWLKEYNIKNYTINDDLTIDVNGFVFLYEKDLTEIPEYIQFGVVKGYFDCSYNNLTSLEGTPEKVKGDFYCSRNELISLEGAPKKVGGDFNCSGNKLTSLKGAPEKVKEGFYCGSNQLISLEGCPREVGGDFNCSSNKLTSLKGVPEEVGRDFFCSCNSIQFTEDDVRKVCNVKRKIYIN